METLGQHLDESAKSYLHQSKKFFEKISLGMTVQNHTQHDVEPDFWKQMIAPLESLQGLEDELALEYGCGAGRNLVNLLAFGNFLRADGLDISKGNAKNSQLYADSRFPGRSICLEGNGWSCLPLRSNAYKFIISHQVFIHIPNRSVRISILQDMVRILKHGGVAVIHFKSMTQAVRWNDNFSKFPRNLNVAKEDLPQIEADFKLAGFSGVTIKEGKNFYDGGYEIFVHATK